MQKKRVRGQFYEIKTTRLLTKHIFILLCFISLINSTRGQVLVDYVPEDKYLGNIVNYEFFEFPERNPAPYEATLQSEFNAIVAENNFKMIKILNNQPQDPFNLKLTDLNTTFIDRMVSWADNNPNGKMLKRGHALIWFSQAPDWLKRESKNWTNDQIYEFSKSYIQLMINYTKDSVEEWDVVNEAINVSYGGFRNGDDIWYKNVSDIQSYIEYCFTVAREADPDKKVKLFYNDFNTEEYNSNDENSKNRFMLSMVEKMVSNNVPIDAVGLQSHFKNDQVNDNFVFRVEQTIDKVNDMGLLCNITELDIRLCGGNKSAQYASQKENYKKVIKMALSKKMSTGLVIWGFTDADSWVPDTFGDCDEALLYDKNYKKKPSYEGVLEALKDLNETPTVPEEKDDLPVAILSVDKEIGFAAEIIKFDASESSDPKGDVLSYDWDFGDGQTATGVNPTHTYTKSGGYIVTLTVSNTKFKKSIDRKFIDIYPEPVPQTAYKAHSIPGIIEVEDYDNGGQNISFYDTDRQNNGDSGRLEQGVDIENSGDTTGAESIGYSADGEWLEYTIGDVKSGSYDIVFRVASNSNDPQGKSITSQLGESIFQPITVGNTGGWKSWQDVTLENVEISAGEQILRIGFIQGGINLNYVKFIQKNITTPPPVNTAPIASFTAAPVNGEAPLEVSFDASGSSDADNDAITYAWNFGNGQTSTSKDPLITFTGAGSYMVSLVVNDGKLDSQEVTETITVTEPIVIPVNSAPVAALTASATNGVAPLTVAFDGNGSTDADNDVLSYSIAFGDGTTGNGSTSSHTYTSAGAYSAVLTVNDGNGGVDTAAVSITVTDDVIIVTPPVNTAPVATLTASVLSGFTPLAVEFDASASTDAEGDTLAYSISYGDNTSGQGVKTSHTYTEEGAYVATVTVTDDKGGSSTATQTIVVEKEVIVTVPPTTGGGNCAFGTPTAAPVGTTYAYHTKNYVLGNDGPDLSNVDGFSISWDLANNGLQHIAMNTSNGVPSYYINLGNKTTHTLGTAQPTITFNGTGIAKLDGTYYVAKDGENLALVSTTSAFTIYFSNETTQPDCNNTPPTNPPTQPSLANCTFGTPVKEPISNTYTYLTKNYVLGNDGPDLSSVNGFSLSWDLANNGLWQIAMNT